MLRDWRIFIILAYAGLLIFMIIAAIPLGMSFLLTPFDPFSLVPAIIFGLTISRLAGLVLASVANAVCGCILFAMVSLFGPLFGYPFRLLIIRDSHPASS